VTAAILIFCAVIDQSSHVR